MSSRNKPFKTISCALSSVWGSPASATNQGGRATKSARRAGVTRDHHLTPMAQKLAAELKDNEDKTALLADPRGAYEKKYDIRENIAHLTPDEFRELLLNPVFLARLKTKVHTIHIDDDSGLAADFVFGERDSNDDNTESVRTEFVVSHGISASLRDKSKVIISSCAGHKTVGTLQARNIPENLVTHSLNHTGPVTNTEILDAQKEARAERVNYKHGNIKIKMRNQSQLASELRASFDSGIELTVGSYIKEGEAPLKLGTLRHSDSINITELNITSITYRKLFGKKAAYNSSRSPSEFLGDFFNNSSGYKIIVDGKPFAILLRDDLETSPKPA